LPRNITGRHVLRHCNDFWLRLRCGAPIEQEFAQVAPDQSAHRKRIAFPYTVDRAVIVAKGVCHLTVPRVDLCKPRLISPLTGDSGKRFKRYDRASSVWPAPGEIES
jgi:hypothetical protein